MQLTVAAITAFLASAAIAAPNRDLKPKGKWVDNNCVPDNDSSCLTDEKAESIFETYETLISRSITGAEFNATVDQLLDANFFTLSSKLSPNSLHLEHQLTYLS
jgi:hypothetical protein